MQDNMFKDWLHRRKISDTILSEFGVTSGDHETLGECIVIPVLNDEGIFSFNKYRRNPLSDDKPKYLYDKGSKTLLYGAFKIKNEKRVLITEGEMDSLVAWSANIPAVSSTGGAMSFQKEWASYFSEKEVIVCFDNDKAGGDGMAKILEVIPWAKVLFLPDRPGIKDISDYVTNGGDLNELIKTAKKFNSIEEVSEDRASRVSVWQSTWFHDAFIENNSKPSYRPRPKVASGDMKNKIERARAFLIPNLLKFKHNKACCIWHNEKDPSLTYYESSNKVYCFGGCGKAYDAIDVYRQLHSCSFKEAVDALQP